MSTEIQFGDIFAVPLRNGVSYSAARRGSGVPMVNMKEIFAFDRISNEECELAPLTETERLSHLLESWDLLFARQSLTFEGAGKCSLVLPVDGERTFESHLMRVRLNPAVASAPFYYYYFRSSQGRRNIETIVQQVAAAGIRGSDLARLKVPFPPLPMQQAIAEVLGTLDDKIDANTKLAQTSAFLAQALFAGSMRAADDDVALSEVTELLSRGVAPKYSDAEDAVVVLNQKCIRDQRVNLSPARRTLMSKVRGDKMLRMDDLLVNSTGQGTLGRVARWTNSGSVTVDSHVTIVRFDQAKVDPVCAGMALLASQKTIEEMGEGSTGQTELSRIELGKLRMRLPERSRQAELGHRIKTMSEMESARLSENQTLAATRDTLLPHLMSGKLRVKDAEKVLENAGV